MKSFEYPKIIVVNRVIILNPKKKKFLIMQRSKSDSWMPLRWEFPGGKLNKGQDINNATEREALEETGLLVFPIDRVVYFESYIVPEGKHKGETFICLIGLSKTLTENVKLSAEHDDFRWVDIAEALEMDLVEESKKAIISLNELIEKQFSLLTTNTQH